MAGCLESTSRLSVSPSINNFGGFVVVVVAGFYYGENYIFLCRIIESSNHRMHWVGTDL